MQINTIPSEHTHELFRGALSVSTHLIAGLSDAQRDTLIHAVKGGANLVMEIGPFPDISRMQLILVEKEGARQNVACVKK